MNTFEIVARVETKTTSLSGSRDSKWSNWEKVTAPEGYVINKDQIKVQALVEMGSENRDEKIFSDYVEIIPGTNIMLPRTFEVRVFARSSRGHGGGKGATEYKYSGDFVGYNK